ncbi:MAG: hypothetical protein IKE01_03390 [Clostridia bacterium]|nr:hypothetical protein [Clostridia bacterium]
MKKIVSFLLVSIILIASVFTLSGCGITDLVKKKKVDQQVDGPIGGYNNYNNEVNNIASNNEVANNVTNSVNNTATPSSTAAVDKTRVDINNKDIYYVEINGKKFTTDSKVKEIETLGFTQNKAAAEKDLPKNNYLIGGGYFQNSDSRTVFSVTPVNTNAETVKSAEATIGGFSIDKYYSDNLKGSVSVCNGITMGTSMEDVEAVFGEPTEKDMREAYESLGIKYTYKASSYKYYEFEFDKQTKTVNKITWRFFDFKA